MMQDHNIIACATQNLPKLDHIEELIDSLFELNENDQAIFDDLKSRIRVLDRQHRKAMYAAEIRHYQKLHDQL